MRGALQKAVQNSSRCGARTNISRACASAVPEKISLDLKNIRNAEVNSRWTRLKEQRDMCENPLPIDLIPRNVTFTKLGDKLLDLPTAKAALLYAVDLNETHALSALDHSQLWQHVAPKLLNQSVEEGESVLDEQCVDLIDRLVADAKLRLHEFGGAHVLSILGAALSSPHCISLSRKVPSLGSFTFAVVDRIAPKATESAAESSTSAEKSSSAKKTEVKVTPVTKILAANPRLAVRAISALAAAEASGTHVEEKIEKYFGYLARCQGKFNFFFYRNPKFRFRL